MLHVIIQPPFNELLANDDGKPKCAHFLVGHSTKDINPEIVVSVLATGPELQHILNNFTQLPRCLSRTEQRWFGDDAKFIVANWM